MHLMWFVPSGGDESRLGDPATAVRPTIEHLTAVAQTAEDAGFEAMLVPTGEMCLDGWVVGAALAQHTARIKFMVAFRPGFINPPVAARQAGTFDRMTGGRLLLNVVTGGHPEELARDGDFLDHDARYDRTEEFLDVVLKSWHEKGFDHAGAYYKVVDGGVNQRPLQKPHPRIYLGGASSRAMEAAARYADVYLMWGEPVALMADRAAQAKELAASYGRTLEVGTRFQVVCRSSTASARADAEDLVSAISESYQRYIRGFTEKTDSVGQQRQNALRGADEWLTDTLWNGFARARTGAAVALVGSGPDIKKALDEYVDAGIDTFILSGYRHDEEAARCGKWLTPLVS